MSHKEAFFIASVSCVLLGTSPQGFWVPEPFLYNPTRVPQTMARLLLATLWSHRTFYLVDIGCIQKRFLILAPQSSLVCPRVGKRREEPVFSAQHSLHQLRDTDQEPTVCQALSLFLWSQIWNKSLLCARQFPYSSVHRCETRAYCMPGTFSIPLLTDMKQEPTVCQALSPFLNSQTWITHLLWVSTFSFLPCFIEHLPKCYSYNGFIWYGYE